MVTTNSNPIQILNKRLSGPLQPNSHAISQGGDPMKLSGAVMLVEQYSANDSSRSMIPPARPEERSRAPPNASKISQGACQI